MQKNAAEKRTRDKANVCCWPGFLLVHSGFLQVLDKYTSLGIYVVHHTFTLAELFALSGLQFTSQTIQSGIKVFEALDVVTCLVDITNFPL